jgi:hypothetical protein
MIDDEKKWAEEVDRRREELDRRLDDDYEYRDTDGYDTDEDEKDD